MSVTETCQACGTKMPLANVHPFNPEPDVVQFICVDTEACGARLRGRQERERQQQLRQVKPLDDVCQVYTDGTHRCACRGQWSGKGVPAYVLHLLDAFLTGQPLNFHSDPVPREVQERLEQAVATGQMGTVPVEPRSVHAHERDEAVWDELGFLADKLNGAEYTISHLVDSVAELKRFCWADRPPVWSADHKHAGLPLLAPHVDAARQADERQPTAEQWDALARAAENVFATLDTGTFPRTAQGREEDRDALERLRDALCAVKGDSENADTPPPPRPLRRWEAGDPEPGPDVTAVVSPGGRRYERNGHGGWCQVNEGWPHHVGCKGVHWAELRSHTPLTEAR